MPESGKGVWNDNSHIWFFRMQVISYCNKPEFNNLQDRRIQMENIWNIQNKMAQSFRLEAKIISASFLVEIILVPFPPTFSRTS